MFTAVGRLLRQFHIPYFYSRSNIIRGALIYCIGDTIAALISGDLAIHRSIGMMIIGGTFYAFEIPNYLLWLHEREIKSNSFLSKLIKPLLFQLYFNPIWIVRHIVFINLISFTPENVGIHLLTVGVYSFLFQLPVSLPVNYLIIEVIPYKWRFIASALFSGLMAIYFAMSESWFG